MMIFCFLFCILKMVYRVYSLELPRQDEAILIRIRTIKVKVSHSLFAVGAVGVRVPLYLGHS